jgi:hypothetical protein
MLGTPPNRRASAVALCLVMVLSAIYLGMNLKRGWIPWDEGILGQSAERVLNGEIPHKDFNDAYTGGLSYLDAFIFRLFGINLSYLRNFLFACFLLWVPAVYSLARDFLRPWTAGAVTLLAVAWSVPNYPAAMPSWFLLFLTTFGTLALSKYATQPKMHWLILAGLCGGLSFLFKTVGLYFIAGGLIFLVFREQDLARTETDTSQNHRTPTFVGFLILCLVIFLSCLIKLVMVPADTPELLHYVLPSLAIASLLAVREFAPSTLPSRQRFSTLFAMAIPFLGAAALPILLCFSFYWWHGALTPFVKEVFVLALRRIQYAHLSPPGLILELPSIVAALIFFAILKLEGAVRVLFSIAVIAIGALVLCTSASSHLSSTLALSSLRGVIPAVVITLAFIRIGKSAPQRDFWMDQRIFLLFSVTALFSIIQFPYAAPIYFCYVAPLAILLLAALLSRLKNAPHSVLYAGGIFYLCFAVIVFRPYAVNIGYKSGQPGDQVVPLTMPRAGNIRISRESSAQYEELIPFVSQLAAGAPIFAGPDCPEVYFLSGLKNPTPILFDFLQDPNEYNTQVTRLLDQPGLIKVVVINNNPAFSGRNRGQLLPIVNKHFTELRTIGVFAVYGRP